MNMALTGGDSFYVSRASLSGGQLNLGQGFGFQDIKLRTKKEIKKIYLKLVMSKESDFQIYFGRSGNSYDALRIRNGKEITWSTVSEGVEKGKGKISAYPNLAEVNLRIYKKNNSTILKLNGERFVLPISTMIGPLGFRGDQTEIGIQHIKVIYGDSSKYVEDFSILWNTKHSIIAAGLILLIILSIKFCFKKNQLYIHYCVFVFLLTALLIDLKIFSPMELNALTRSVGDNNERSIWDKLEHLRSYVFYSKKFQEELKLKTYQVYPIDRIQNGPIVCVGRQGCKPDALNLLAEQRKFKNRVLLVGTSQSVGAGASNLGETFFSMLHHRLPPANSFSFNISKSGESPEEMLSVFKQSLKVFKPTVVILNLGFNPSHRPLREVFEGFLEVASKDNLQIVLVREANSESGIYHEYVELVELISIEHAIPLIDLYKYMRSLPAAESGMLWWDSVHFTDYGHKLAAEFLYKELLSHKLIKL